MQTDSIEHMFNFKYEKSSEEIVERAEVKRQALLNKIEERKGRLTRLRDEYGITDGVLIDLLQQARANAHKAVMQYTSNSTPTGKGLTENTVTVPAGVVNNLMTEQDFIAAEGEQVKKLDLIIRNLVDVPDERRGREGEVRGHVLTTAELTYLGF